MFTIVSVIVESCVGLPAFALAKTRGNIVIFLPVLTKSYNNVLDNQPLQAPSVSSPVLSIDALWSELDQRRSPRSIVHVAEDASIVPETTATRYFLVRPIGSLSQFNIYRDFQVLSKN